MTTETPRRSTGSVSQTVADRQRELEELRAAMRAREAMQPDTPEFERALAHEEELLERIHEWSLGRR